MLNKIDYQLFLSNSFSKFTKLVSTTINIMNADK